MLAERDLGRNICSSRQTVSQYLHQWLDISGRPRLREKSFRDYSALLARYVRSRLGESRFGELSAAGIQGLYGELLNRKLSAPTIRYTHSVLFSALRQTDALCALGIRFSLPRLGSLSIHVGTSLPQDRVVDCNCEIKVAAKWRREVDISVQTGVSRTNNKLVKPLR